MINDNVLEEAMINITKTIKERPNQNIQTYQKRARISIEAMSIIKSLIQNGWNFDRIATTTNVMEITVRRWASGERVPHTNNLLALRKLKDYK